MKHCLPLLLLLWGCMALNPAWAQKSQRTAPWPDTAYYPGVVLLKLWPQARTQIDAGGLPGALLLKAFTMAGVQQASRRFPKHQPPEAPFNRYGQPLVDLSLQYELKLKPGASVPDAIQWLRRSAAVQYAEPQFKDFALLPRYDPNDADTAGLWWTDMILAREAWAISKGDTNVTIGIIDTGFDLAHPDMQGAVQLNLADPIDGIDNDGDGYVDNYQGWDLAGPDYLNLSEDNNPNITGGSDHGALVSGNACARTDNSIGVLSAGFQARYLPIKAAADNDATGSIRRGYEGVVYAADHGCHILNLSWGSGFYSAINQDVINYAAVNKGCLIYAAGGNDAIERILYPAGYDNVQGVASSSVTDYLASPSNFGTHIDVMAPYRAYVIPAYPSSYAIFFTGYTSLACPMAASAAALVRAHFPSYSNAQVGEQLRITCDEKYTQHAAFPQVFYKLGTGRINLYRALTETWPSVRHQSKSLKNAQGSFPNPGDTAELRCQWINWLQGTTQLGIKAISLSPYVTFVDDTLDVGSLATLATTHNNGSPIRFRIDPAIPENQKVEIILIYRDGAYYDFEVFPFYFNPNFLNLDANLISLSVGNQGNFGYCDPPYNGQGLGFSYDGAFSSLYEGGMLASDGTGLLVDAIRSNLGQNQQWQRVGPFQKLAPGPTANQQISGLMDDVGPANQQLGLKVRQRALAQAAAPDDNFVILEYTYRNDTNHTLNDFFAGLYADWDVVDYATNRAEADSALRMAYAYDAGQTQYMGIVALTPGPVSLRSVPNDGSFNYSMVSKWQALRDGLAHTQAGMTGGGTDVAQFVGIGPIDLSPGDSIPMAFALIGAPSLDSLRASAARAHQVYRCSQTPSRPKLDWMLASDELPEAPTSGSIDCRSYEDYPLAIVPSTTPDWDVKLRPYLLEFSENNLPDFELLADTLVFPAGSSASQFVTLRIYDDASTEGLDSLSIGFELLNVSDALWACGSLSMKVKIIDNDAPGTPAQLPATDLCSYSVYLGPYDTVYVHDGAKLLLRLENLSAHDYGCTSFSIDRSGTGAQAFQQSTPASFAASKTFHIQPASNLDTGYYRITTYYTEDEIAGWEAATGSNRSELTLFKTAGVVNNVSPADPMANGGANYYASNPLVLPWGSHHALQGEFATGFSGFGAGKQALDGIGPLPVELLAFEARAQVQGIGLNWQAQLTPDVHTFDVQWGADLSHFQSIGNRATLPGPAFTAYSFLHTQPLPGQNYYRLRWTDGAGTLHASPVRLAWWEQDFVLLPGAPGQALQLNWSGQKVVEARLFDMEGRQLGTWQLDTPGPLPDTERLSAGVYTLSWSAGQDVHTAKVLRQ